MAALEYEKAFRSPKLLSPETADAILAEARAAAAVVAQKIDEFEGLSVSELLGRRGEVFGLLAALLEHFKMQAPPGAGHEPQVLAYNAWSVSGATMQFMNNFGEIVNGIPQNGFRRLQVLAESIPGHVIARTAISSNARRGGVAKLRQNPAAMAKADAKAGAHALWLERERGLLPNLRTEDAFAIEVCRRWPALSSIGTVKKWSTQWRKDAARNRMKRDD